MKYYAISKKESLAVNSQFRYSDKEAAKKGCAEMNKKATSKYFVFEISINKV